MQMRRSDLAFAAYVLVAVAASVWPVLAWAGVRIEPFVAGLPFPLAWTVGWVLATFLALLLYHLGRRG